MVVCLSPNGSTTLSGETAPDRLVVATLDGVVTAERDDSQFRVVAGSLPGVHISSLHYEPTREAIFAGSYSGGIHVSYDKGATWERTAPQLRDHDVYCVTSRTDGESVTLFAGMEPVALFMSTDYGATWTELPAIREMPNRDKWTFPGPPHEAHLKNIAFDAGDPFTFFASIEQGGLFKTIDGGRSWTEFESIDQSDDDWYRDVHRMILDPREANVMFITGGDGLTKTTDGGKSWSRVLGTDFVIGYPDGLLMNPDDPDFMLISGARHQPGTWRESRSADAHIARSTDGGTSWEIVSNGLPDPLRANIEALSMAVHPAGTEIFAGTTAGEVYASADGGDQFSLALSGMAPVSKGGHYRALMATQ